MPNGPTPNSPTGEAPPGPGDPILRLLLVLAAGLLAFSWARIEGFQIADAVEYLERARHLVLGEEMIDSQAIRGFGYSGLLVPLFALAELVGLRDMVLVAHAARLMQMGLTLCLVVVTARLAARLGGRRAGYGAALFVAANPIILRWGVSPVSGIAAALFVALALDALTETRSERTPAKRGLVAGLWLGLSLMMAYKTILVIGPILVALFVTPRRHAPKAARSAVLAGLVACLLLQATFDRLYYGPGSFGVSLSHYVVENFGSIAAKRIHMVGKAVGSQALEDLAQTIYNEATNAATIDEAYQAQMLADPSAYRQKQPPDWYLTNLPRLLSWPGIALVALGVLAALRRPSWYAIVSLAVIGLTAAIMSDKGYKEYRLWIPFLPLIAVFGGVGFAALAGAGRGARLGTAVLALGAVVVLGTYQRSLVNTRVYGAFWRAMERINEAAGLEAGARRAAAEADWGELDGEAFTPRRTRASCAFHWAVFLRDSPDVHLIKLPKHLDHWKHYTDAERAADLEAIAALDWFVVHLPTLTERPELMEAVNRDFAVDAVFYDRTTFEGLGPIYVMRKRTGEPGERALYDLREVDDPRAFAAARGLGRSVPFVDGTGELELLGFEYEPMPGDDYGWITYHWAGRDLADDWTLVDRITSPLGEYAWYNNHRPAYGMHPTSTLRAGTVLSESYLVVPEEDPFREGGASRHLGGPYRRGDLVPADVWMDVAIYDDEGRRKRRLHALHPESRRPLFEVAPPGHFPGPRGWRVSPDGLAWIGRLFLPVHDAARWSSREPVPGTHVRL